MKHVNLADAKAGLSPLVDRAEAGEVVDILRRGRPAARLIPPTPRKAVVDVAALRALAARLPRQQTISAAKATRTMRDAERY